MCIEKHSKRFPPIPRFSPLPESSRDHPRNWINAWNKRICSARLCVSMCVYVWVCMKRMTVFLENSFHGDRCLQFPKAMSTIDHRQLGTNFVLEKLDKRRRARISWLTNLIDLIFYILRPLSHRWILVATRNRNSNHFLRDSISSSTRWRVKELIFLVGEKSTAWKKKCLESLLWKETFCHFVR